jgi:hypothetical protein
MLDYDEEYPIFLIPAPLLDFEGIERHVLNKSGGLSCGVIRVSLYMFTSNEWQIGLQGKMNCQDFLIVNM